MTDTRGREQARPRALGTPLVEPAGRRSSRELVFRNDRTWYRVPIGTGPGDPVGRVVEWFTDPAFIDTPGRSNSILADGRLVYVRSVAGPTTTVLSVIPAFRANALRALEQ